MTGRNYWVRQNLPKKKKMLMSVVPTIEYVKLKEIVSEIDDKAFFLIVDAYESSVKKKCKNM